MELAVLGQLDAVPLVGVVGAIVVTVAPLALEDASASQLALELVFRACAARLVLAARAVSCSVAPERAGNAAALGTEELGVDVAGLGALDLVLGVGTVGAAVATVGRGDAAAVGAAPELAGLAGRFG